jgi:hypothetical protein
VSRRQPASLRVRAAKGGHGNFPSGPYGHKPSSSIHQRELAIYGYSCGWGRPAGRARPPPAMCALRFAGTPRPKWTCPALKRKPSLSAGAPPVLRARVRQGICMAAAWSRPRPGPGRPPSRSLPAPSEFDGDGGGDAHESFP